MAFVPLELAAATLIDPHREQAVVAAEAVTLCASGARRLLLQRDRAHGGTGLRAPWAHWVLWVVMAGRGRRRRRRRVELVLPCGLFGSS